MTRKYRCLEAGKFLSPYLDVKPVLINADFLVEKRIDIEPAFETLTELTNGSIAFQSLLDTRALTTTKEYTLENVPEDLELDVHNYTGKCPTNVFEVNPIKGACSISCLYCLVTDGNHVRPIAVYEDYAEWLNKKLVEHKGEEKFFYYSPKTEAFCEPLLESGVAHKILRTFREHYKIYPKSKVRLFIATKAGPKHLDAKFEGESILDLLLALRGKMQVNGSIGMMPSYLHEILEPNAPSVKDRLDALRILQKNGVFARSILLQPIMLYHLSKEVLDEFFDLLASYDIENIKPEFLTVNMFNIAIIAQYVNYHEPDKIKKFLEVYIAPENRDHKKQRCRTAPNREECKKFLGDIIETALRRNISVSICEWVKACVGFDKSVLNKSRERGYRCLGYQERMFENDFFE